MVISNVPKCNWYTVDSVYNGNVYIQGPFYNVSEITDILDILSTEYPITETIVGITIGLLLPCLCLFLFFTYKYFYRKNEKNNQQLVNMENQIKCNKNNIKDDIVNYLFKTPSYDEKVLNEKEFKQFLHIQTDEILEKYLKFKSTLVNDIDTCCFICKNKKVNLYNNIYGFKECDKCNLTRL